VAKNKRGGIKWVGGIWEGGGGHQFDCGRRRVKVGKNLAITEVKEGGGPCVKGMEIVQPGGEKCPGPQNKLNQRKVLTVTSRKPFSGHYCW